MTVRAPIVRISGKLVELPTGDYIGGAPSGTNGTNGTNGVNGGATTISYTFDTTTTDADPGSGKLRLNNATQNSATTIYADLLDTLGSDWTTVIDTFDDSTNTTKGAIRLVKSGDATKFLTFNVTAVVTATGYRKITITNTGSSTSSPFVNGDTILLCFDRAGDKGADGTGGNVELLLGYATATTTYTVNPSPTSDTTVKQNDGTTDLSVTVTTTGTQNLRVAFFGRFTQASGGIRMNIYMDGSKVSPSTSLNTLGWYAAGTLGTDSDHVMVINTPILSVAAGTHTFLFKHQTAASTNALAWGDRCAFIYQLPF